MRSCANVVSNYGAIMNPNLPAGTTSKDIDAHFIRGYLSARRAAERLNSALNDDAEANNDLDLIIEKALEMLGDKTALMQMLIRDCVNGHFMTANVNTAISSVMKNACQELVKQWENEK